MFSNWSWSCTAYRGSGFVTDFHIISKKQKLQKVMNNYSFMAQKKISMKNIMQ